MRLPFGLRNVGQTFQRFIDHVLHGLDFVCTYIDDVLVASHSVEEHMNYQRIIFERFQKYGIIINPIKCAFGKTEVEFLSNCLGVVGIFPSPTKTEAKIQVPVPTNMKSFRQFLGMVNFYRRFIPNCASILQPLTNLLTNIKRCDIVVSGDALSAFSKTKAALAKTTELSHVLPDVELYLAVDASAVGVGVVLEQKVSGSWKPTSFFPQKLTSIQKRYGTFRREL